MSGVVLVFIFFLLLMALFAIFHVLQKKIQYNQYLVLAALGSIVLIVMGNRGPKISPAAASRRDIISQVFDQIKTSMA